MGFEFTHFGEFAWAQLEPQEGVYDFKWLDKAVEIAVKYKLKIVMCTSTATPPVWLVRKHPDILATYEDGTKTDHGSRQHASFSSNYYRSYSLKMIEELQQNLIAELQEIFQMNRGDHSVTFEVMELEKVKRVGEAPLVVEDDAVVEEVLEDAEIDIPEEKEEIRVVTKLSMPSRKLKVNISAELLQELEKMQLNFRLN